jgi:hypothetical protein
MLAIPLEAATGSSKRSTTSGLESDEPLVRDVTLEILGEQRQEWRDGYDAGLKAGSQRVLQSQMIEDIALEVKMLRLAVTSLGQQAEFWRQKFLDAVHVIGNPR